MDVPWNYQCQNASPILKAYGGNHAHNLTGLDILNSAIFKIMNKAKSDFDRNMISNSSDNRCQLWNYINGTLPRKASFSLPGHDSTNSLYNSFPNNTRIRLSKFMLPFHFLLLVVILIFQLNSSLFSNILCICVHLQLLAEPRVQDLSLHFKYIYTISHLFIFKTTINSLFRQ